MELDDEAKKAVRELGDAINAAVGESFRVAEAIEHLREIGFEPNLSLKLEIGLLELSNEAGFEENLPANADDLELTDEDLKTLRNMKIRFE
jgi:hypothetical protein